MGLSIQDNQTTTSVAKFTISESSGTTQVRVIVAIDPGAAKFKDYSPTVKVLADTDDGIIVWQDVQATTSGVDIEANYESPAPTGAYVKAVAIDIETGDSVELSVTH